MRNYDAKYHLDIPYPTVQVDGPNQQYGMLLLQDYASAASELTAACQYSYQYYVNKNCNPDVAQMLLEIGQDEMHHLHMLGETICLLGVNPRYRVIDLHCREHYWCGSYVDGSKTLKKQLMENIAGEQKAICNYQKRLEQICDENITAMIRRILLDEEHHMQLLQNALQDLC